MLSLRSRYSRLDRQQIFCVSVVENQWGPSKYGYLSSSIPQWYNVKQCWVVPIVCNSWRRHCFLLIDYYLRVELSFLYSFIKDWLRTLALCLLYLSKTRDGNSKPLFECCVVLRSHRSHYTWKSIFDTFLHFWINGIIIRITHSVCSHPEAPALAAPPAFFKWVSSRNILAQRRSRESPSSFVFSLACNRTRLLPAIPLNPLFETSKVMKVVSGWLHRK